MAYTFTGVIGDRGSGKTQLLAWIGYTRYMLGRNVVANFRLKFPSHYMTFETIRSLPDELEEATLLLDELSEGADAYEFLSRKNKGLTTMVSQMRKLFIDAYYTDQRLNKVTKRLRDQTDNFIFMEDIDVRKPGHDFWNCDAKFHVTVTTDNLVILNEFLFDGKPVQHLYDSREIIRDRPSDQKGKPAPVIILPDEIDDLEELG